MSLRPGISFKLNPPKVKEPRIKVPKKRKIRGLCFWCDMKGADLIENKYGLFHSNGNQDCFKQFFFAKVRTPLVSPDESQTQQDQPTP
jgi:hypothetical protein